MQFPDRTGLETRGITRRGSYNPGGDVGLNPEPSRSKKRRDSVVALKRPECPQLFFVFQGHGHQLLLDPLEFLRETDLVSRNLAMFRDQRRAFFQLGVSDQFPDWESLLTWQREFRAGLPGVEETYCVGTSAGSLAAIQFGYHLQVDAVWAFGPNTRIDVDTFAEKPGRARLKDLPQDRLDLAHLLATSNGKTEYHLVYSEDEQQDRRHSEHLADCPGVTLHPKPGSDHNVLLGMRDRDELADLFPTWSPISSPRGKDRIT